jgi:hypothetical protein
MQNIITKKKLLRVCRDALARISAEIIIILDIIDHSYFSNSLILHYSQLYIKSINSISIIMKSNKSYFSISFTIEKINV